MSMTAIGEQLREAREARGLTIEYVAAETNIARRYLTAMEDEDFTVFPGEPYIVGFLRNYAEYLGLDAGAMVQAFKGLRLQEQQVPIQELLRPARPKAWPFVLGGAAIIAAAAVFIVVSLPGTGKNPEPDAMKSTQQMQYTMETAVFEKRVYEGDTILVPYNGDTHRITIGDIHDRVAFQTPVGVSRFTYGEEGMLDLDKDNNPELLVFVQDFQKNKPDEGAMIRMTATGMLATIMASANPGSTGTPGTEPDQPTVTPASTASSSPAATSSAVAATPDRPGTQESIVFSGKRSPHPFVVNVVFRNYSMFRHEIDRKTREERYYHKGEQITVTANNSAKLWASNAAAAKLTIQASGGQSVDVELGVPGEVTVKQIRWTQADDGTWSLGVYEVH